ncbi:anti-sigma factor [Microbacteriaceae bacterium VKM Ac-2854]|nr:anti-sigma factor [Microbacteriaceae bacterium VKM Ac-2854]
MTDAPNSDDPRDLAAGYALGILTPEELVRYEEFLAAHPRAALQRDDFAETAAALGFDAPEIAPAPAMKADLMALIARTPQEQAPQSSDSHSEQVQPDDAPEQGSPLQVESPVTPDAPSAPEGAVGPVEAAARRRWFSKPAGYLSIAAAAAVIVVGGITLPTLLGPSSYQQQQTALEQIRQAPDAQQATDTLASGEEATVIWSASLAKSVVVVDGLAELPSDKTYELWYIGNSGPVPAGTFDSAGSGTTVRALDGTMSTGAVVAITVEPAAGSDAPTSEPILAVPTA